MSCYFRCLAAESRSPSALETTSGPLRRFGTCAKSVCGIVAGNAGFLGGGAPRPRSAGQHRRGLPQSQNPTSSPSTVPRDDSSPGSDGHRCEVQQKSVIVECLATAGAVTSLQQMLIQIDVSLHECEELRLICESDVCPTNGTNDTKCSSPTAQLQHVSPFSPSTQVIQRAKSLAFDRWNPRRHVLGETDSAIPDDASRPVTRIVIL